MGQLNEIILNLDSEIDGKYILEDFAKRRMICGKKCQKGSNCRWCELIDKVSSSLEKSKLIVSSRK